MRRALVTGGTGFVGRAVVQALRGRGCETQFTWHSNADVAATLGGGIRLDLRAQDAAQTLFADLGPIDVWIHCAGVSAVAPLAELSLAQWEDAHHVNLRAPFLLAQAFAAQAGHDAGGDIAFLGALAPGQSLPIPTHFAATQGGLGALTMALGRELAPQNIRVNMVALGLLDGGLSDTLPAETIEDYTKYSAFRRRGTAAEAAETLLFLALENSYMTGRVIAANGGI